MFNRIAGCHGPAELTLKLTITGARVKDTGAHLHFGLLELRGGKISQGRAWGLCWTDGSLGALKAQCVGAPSVILRLFSPGVCPFPPTGIGYRYPLALLNSSTSI